MNCMTQEQIKTVISLVRQGVPMKAIAKKLGVSRMTIHRYMAEDIKHAKAYRDMVTSNLLDSLK